jgi:hypothetical protein
MRTCSLYSGLFLPLFLLGTAALEVRAEDAPGAPPTAEPEPSRTDPLGLNGPARIYPVAPDTALSCEVACDADEETFTKGALSVQVLGGAYFSPVHIGPRVAPRFNFAPVDVRFGWMLCCPWLDHCFLRGNVEALLELTEAPVTAGFGSIVAGPTALLRYNFVQPEWKVVPYIQGGAGIVYNDAWRDHSQRALGEQWEFYLQATAGVHCLLSPHWSVDLEGGFLHISNANMAARNGGVNALGGSLGVTYYFGKCGR